jgi:hypothetical protein
MPELWGAPLPVWAIIIIALLYNNPSFIKLLNKILSVLGIAIKEDKEAEATERQWRRNRDDKMFDVLKSLIDGFQMESKDRDKILSNLAMALHKNTDTVARLIDQVRILGYNAAVVDESLKEIKEHIETRRLRYEED